MKSFIKNNYFYICAMAIIAFFTYFLISYSGKQSLWCDSLFQIGIHRAAQLNDFKGTVQWIIANDNNPPLSHFLTWAWMLVAPYGNMWLRLPSIIITGIGAYFIALICRDMMGNRAGLISLLFSMTSSGVALYSSFEIRPYALMYMLVSMLLFVFFRRHRVLSEISGNKTTSEEGRVIIGKYRDTNYRADSRIKKYTIWYTIIMILALYTHFFCALVIFILFIFDTIDNIRIKNAKYLIQYFVAGAAFLPWMILFIKVGLEKAPSFWTGKPDASYIPIVINSLVAYVDVLKYLFWIAIVACFLALIFTYIVRPAINKRNIEKGKTLVAICGDYELFLIMTLVVTIVGGIFVISNTEIMSLWVPRYFVCVQPCFFVIIAWFVEQIIKLVLKAKYWIIKVPVFIIVAWLLGNNIRLEMLYTDYTGVIMSELYEGDDEYVLSQPDAYDDSVLYYIVAPTFLREGNWYYLTHDGRDEEKKVFYTGELTEADLIGVNTIYVANLHDHDETTQATQKMIDKRFVFVENVWTERVYLDKYIRRY